MYWSKETQTFGKLDVTSEGCQWGTLELVCREAASLLSTASSIGAPYDLGLEGSLNFTSIRGMQSGCAGGDARPGTGKVFGILGFLFQAGLLKVGPLEDGR